MNNVIVRVILIDHYEESSPYMQAENRGQSRSASLASLVPEGEPAVLLASKLSGPQVFSFSKIVERLILRQYKREGVVLNKMMLSKVEDKRGKVVSRFT